MSESLESDIKEAVTRTTRAEGVGSLERDIKNAVDVAFDRKETIILAEEIAFYLTPRLVRAVQREIDSRFGDDGRLKHPDAPSPRSAVRNRKRGSR